MANPWMTLSLNAMRLTMEANTVIGLRMMKAAAGGPAAKTEATRMVTEKIEAAMAVQAQMLTAGLTGAASYRAPAKAVALYRRKVRANRRRLLAGK